MNIVQPSAIQRVAASVSPPSTVANPIKLHAPDHAGQVAHEAAMFADAVTYGLLAASSPTLDPTARRKALERLFSAWPSLCRVMAELEAAAPRSAAAGAEIAARLRDVAERGSSQSQPCGDGARSPSSPQPQHHLEGGDS